MSRLRVPPVVAVGLVGGAVLGLREGLTNFAANAFADASHYGLAYVVVPIAMWFGLAPLVLAPVALVGRLSGRGGIAFYAAALGMVGAVLAMLPSLEDGLVQAAAMGAAPRAPTLAVLGGALVALALAAGWLSHVAATTLARRPRVVVALTTVAALVGTLAVTWTAHFTALNLAPTRVRPATASAPPPSGAPNVLLVSIDTLRTDAVGAYGGATAETPTIDRLAAEGATFDQAISPAPWTLPAVASILTGLYPRHHGAGAIANERDPLARTPLVPDVQTLAGALADRGYRTHAIVTNPYLFARSGLDRGFESYDNLTFVSEVMVSGRRNAALWLIDHLAPQLVAGDRGVEVSDRAVRWLDDVGVDDRPFFLWLHYLDPHGPYGGPAGSRHKSFRGELSLGSSGALVDVSHASPDPARLRSGEIRLDAAGKRAMRALYDGEVATVDRELARVLDALARRGLAERTLVVCVSDHGEEFWDHGGVEHGHTLYDELLRAVLVMRWPGHVPAGLRVRGVVSTVDVAPTIASLVGIGGMDRTDGVPLVPALAGRPSPARAVIGENLLFAEDAVALRTDRMKLVRWADGREEAYDLRRDPGERRNLAGRERVLARLRTGLDATIAAMGPAVAPVAGARIPAGALRVLGYVD